MYCINFYGGPCSGKSTLAGGLFHYMKTKAYNVELAMEFAKDCVWEDNINMLEDQLYVFAHQHRRLLRLKNNADYAITDSPILLSTVYREKYGTSVYTDSLDKLVKEVYRNYNNIDIFVTRAPNFKELGRYHNQQESIDIDNEIKSLLEEMNPNYLTVGIDITLPTLFRYMINGRQ